MKDVTTGYTQINKETKIDLNNFELNIDSSTNYCMNLHNRVDFLNGRIQMKSTERGILANEFVSLQNVQLYGEDNMIVALSINAGATVINSDIKIGAYTIASFADNNNIIIENSKIVSTQKETSLYHNGSFKGFKLTAIDTKFDGEIYISANISIAYQEAKLTNCEVTGKTAIEVKYTNLTLNNCKVTATDTPSYTYNNNGSTTTGAAVVSSDNTINGTPAPDGVIVINGGEYIGLVGLKEIARDQYPELREVTYKITNAKINGKIVNNY